MNFVESDYIELVQVFSNGDITKSSRIELELFGNVVTSNCIYSLRGNSLPAGLRNHPGTADYQMHGRWDYYQAFLA